MHAVAEMQARITVGVDTHTEIHVAAALDQLGRQLAAQFTAALYKQGLLDRLRAHAHPWIVGIVQR